MFERLLVEESLPLHPGDLYLLFTDGITEAMNAADDCFGETRLAQIVEKHAHLPSDQLRERVLREIEAFVGDAPQHDDMTMILLKVESVAAAVASSGGHLSHPFRHGSEHLPGTARGAPGALDGRVGASEVPLSRQRQWTLP